MTQRAAAARQPPAPVEPVCEHASLPKAGGLGTDIDMADVFISYARDDRAQCAGVADKLTSLGFDVWFDARLQSGTSFDAEIEEQIRAAKAVLVLWSPRSVKSAWVRNEATLGQRRNILVSAQIAPCELPIQFINTHTEPLRADDLRDDDPAWRNVLLRIADLCHAAPLAERLERQASAALKPRRRGMLVPLVAGLVIAMVAGAVGVGGWVYPGVFRSKPVLPGATETKGADIAATTPDAAPAPPAPAAPAATAAVLEVPAKYDVTSLFPDLGDPVKQARAAQAEALEAEKLAKAAALRGDEAAARARAGAPGTKVYDYGPDASGNNTKHYEGDYGPTGHNGFGVQSMRVGNLARGDYYKGGFKDNQRSGLGVYVYAPTGIGPQGTERNSGQWAMGVPNGVGVTEYIGGDRLAGREVGGGHTGPGVLSYADGRRYEGELKASLPEGLGVLWKPDGSVLAAGIWREGKLVTPYGAQGK